LNGSHRKRIITAVIALSFLTQIVLVSMGILGVNRMDRQLEAQAHTRLLDYASHNVAAYFSQLTSMTSFLQSGDLGEYARSFIAFKDTESAARKAEQANNILRQLKLQDSLIDKIYILGNFSFQGSLLIRDGQTQLSEGSVPSIEDLSNTDLLPILQFSRNRPVVFQPGELTGRLRQSPVLTAGQAEDVQKLAQSLEGRIILNGGVINGSPASIMVIIVLKERLLASLVHTDASASFTLIDHTGSVLDQTGLPEGDNSIVHVKTIDTSGLKLTMHATRSAVAESNKAAFLQKYILFFVAAMSITFLVAYVFTSYLIMPLRLLSHRMTKQHLMFPLQYLRLDDIHRGLLPSLPLRKKLIVLFFVAVCLPAVSSGIMYDRYLHSFAIQQLKPAVQQFTTQAGMNISRQAIVYEDLIRKLSINPTFIQQVTNRNLAAMSTMLQLPDVSFLQYAGIHDTSYFVLYNLLGSRIYSNQNAESFNSPGLDIKMRDVIDGTDDTLWLTNGRDLFNQPTVSLVKAIYDNYAARKPIGYIQIVFAQSAFQSILPQNDAYTMTFDADDNLLIRNDLVRKQDGGIASQAKELIETNGLLHSGVSLVYEDKRLNWQTHFITPTDTIDTMQRTLILWYAGVIVSSVAIAMLLAFGLSRWLLRALEHLKLAMEHQIEEVQMDRHITYTPKARDEIGEMIVNYNRMLARLNELMAENIRIAEEHNLGLIRQQELLSLKIQAELNMLQLQINPHFLYNTLQNIGMRTQGAGDGETSFLIYALADLFRYSVGQTGHDVALAEEIRHTRNYIAIQEFRFKNKFTVEWEVAESVLSCRIIKFVLQPLVENAITHGFLNSIRVGTIRIHASLQEGELTLTIRDNGLGIEPQQLEAIKAQWARGLTAAQNAPEPTEMTGVEEASAAHASQARSGTGIGLSNVYHRLMLLYNGNARMEIESEWFEGTVIRLVIPQPDA